MIVSGRCVVDFGVTLGVWVKRNKNKVVVREEDG